MKEQPDKELTRKFDAFLKENFDKDYGIKETIDKKEILRSLLDYKYEDFVSFFTNKDGKEQEFYMEEDMVSYLLDENVLFCNSRKYLCIDGSEQPSTIILFMNCNDAFAWACADAEEVTMKELPELCRMHIEDKDWGDLKWVCKKRNMQPQKPIREAMKKDNVWCELMESLNPNPDEKKEIKNV